MRALISGDFNNDGRVDFALSAGSGVRIFLNNGTGGFTAGASVNISGSNSLAVGDLDGDGDLDIVGAVGATGMRVALNNGSGAFGGATIYSGGSGIVSAHRRHARRSRVSKTSWDHRA